MATLDYNFDTPAPIESTPSVLPKQERLGNGSLRLDTGSSDTQKFNAFGLPVFSSARLQNPDDSTDFLELLTVRFVVAQTKNIDTVAVNGLSGTIKTYINDGDFAIDLQIILTTNNPDDYPIEESRRLIGFLNSQKPILVMCDFLQLFNIYQIVVTDYTIGQLEGVQNAQIFDIAALSDNPIVLIEKRN